MSERTDQRDCWEALARDATYESPMQKMLCEEDAATAERDAAIDREEVLAALPKLRPGTRAVELGAGVGRFTEHLSRRVGHLTAYDFVEDFVKANRARCAELGLAHVDVVCADAATLALPESLDLVFSNWLVQFLSDPEAARFLGRCAAALAPSGFLFFRESCDVADAGLETPYGPWTAEYPARYRSARWYTEALAQVEREHAGTMLRRAEVLPLWSSSGWSTVQCIWLWQRAA